MDKRRVVYYCQGRFDALGRFARELEAAGQPARADGETLVTELAGLTLALALETRPETVLWRLQREYVSLLLLDLRGGDGAAAFAARRQHALELIRALDRVDDVESRYGFHRIAVLVSEEDGPAVDDLLLELGAMGLRMGLRQRQGDAGFAGRVLADVVQAVRARKVGKTALCLSGGGTTGIYFEQGALKCLQDCLPDGALNAMDMYFGISAGAVCGSLLAVGYSVDEFMACVAGVAGSRMPELELKLASLTNLNLGDIPRRMFRAAQNNVRSLKRVLFGRARPSLEWVVQQYVDMWAPPFNARALERYLRQAFEQTGSTNDFAKLGHELFIGASDLDLRQHVLFGSREAPAVPISCAVEASVSFSPAFRPVKIGDRYYEDGAVTRTSNFVEAIERGATLLVIVDPFVPLVSKRAGGHAKRGLFYNMDQNIRTMSYSRFDTARNSVLRRHPEVSAYTFLPSNRLRRLLTGNPMDHRPYARLWRGAYLSTLARIERLEPKLKGDLAAHGLQLDLTRARTVAAQLEPAIHPSFEDFFPGRRVILAKPPLTAAPPRPRIVPARG